MDVKKSSGVTFDIVLDENVTRREPKRMLLMKNKQKEPLTANEIEKRQRLAEERRQARIQARLKRMHEREATKKLAYARIQARLKRMHEREEATKKLAYNVDILLQQQSLRTGQIPNPDDVPIMSHREILKTANDVVKEFNKMQRQLLNMDLKVDERKHRICHSPETKLQKALKSSKKGKNTQRGMTNNLQLVNEPVSDISPKTKAEQKPGGVVFEIPCDDLGGSKQCSMNRAIASLQKKNLKRSDQEIAAIKLAEKQQQAAECRQRRLENKVRRTRENREALTGLRTKVNIFRQHQAALEGETDSRMLLSEHEAACLAQDIADGFSNIHSRYKTDLERAEGFFMVYDKT